MTAGDLEDKLSVLSGVDNPVGVLAGAFMEDMTGVLGRAVFFSANLGEAANAVLVTFTLGLPLRALAVFGVTLTLARRDEVFFGVLARELVDLGVLLGVSTLGEFLAGAFTAGLFGVVTAAFTILADFTPADAAAAPSVLFLFLATGLLAFAAVLGILVCLVGAFGAGLAEAGFLAGEGFRLGLTGLTGDFLRLGLAVLVGFLPLAAGLGLALAAAGLGLALATACLGLALRPRFWLPAALGLVVKSIGPFILNVTSLSAGLTGLIGLIGCMAVNVLCRRVLAACGLGGDLAMMSMVAMVIRRVLVVTAGEWNTFECDLAYAAWYTDERRERVSVGDVASAPGPWYTEARLPGGF